MGTLRKTKKLLFPKLFEAKKYVIKKIEQECRDSKNRFTSICKKRTGCSTVEEIKRTMDVKIVARRTNNA